MSIPRSAAKEIHRLFWKAMLMEHGEERRQIQDKYRQIAKDHDTTAEKVLRRKP